MAKPTKEQLEQMAEAIARVKEEVAGEVQDHKAEDKALDEVVGGAGVSGNDEILWYIAYSTSAAQ
jgi:hypothetical protein